MVATRRGVRVYSPTRSDQDQNQNQDQDQTCSVPATPSTGRRTRSSAKRAESPTQHAPVETSSQLEKVKERPQASPHTSPMRRCTRASRLHSPEQPCTPASSSHEADVSDRESCCSVVSDVQPSVTRSRGRRRQPRTVIQEDEEISEVESCSSAASASRVSQSTRRSTRRKTVPKSPDTAHDEEVTRSQRRTRSSVRAKQQTEDSELSDADSCVSSVSAVEVSRSTTRRATRSRSQTAPIPFALDEASESSKPLPPRAQRSRAARGKAAAAMDVSEPQSCDSEGFESGPTYSMSTRRRAKTQSTGPKALDSDSELTDVHSPMGRGTPCSSRTGSGSSSGRAACITRTSVRDCHIVLEKTRHPAEDSLNDSRLESTVIAEDAECTLVEGDESQPLEEEKGDVNRTDLTSEDTDTVSVEKRVIVISEDPPLVPPLVSDSPSCAKEAVRKAAVIVKHQQEEPCAQNEDGDISEEETMQGTSQTSELLKPRQPTVTSCESASEPPEEAEDKHEAMEAADVDAHSSQGDEAVDAVVETRPSEEEEEEVSTLHEDAQQVVDSSDVHIESIQVTSSQQHNVTVESDPEQQTKDVDVQKTKIISLLESSEDEDDDAAEGDERDVSGVEDEEDLELQAKERAGPSQKRDTAAASVDGLFMIDTRPGQEADEQYYQETPREEEEGEEEEQDEEFVDEEGDDDDEEAEILFSSRNPELKELSSRIDPGFRVKELGGLYINFDGSKSKPVSSSLQKLKEKKSQDEVMKKSVMGPDFEKKDAVPPYSESKKALKLKHRTEREKSTGDAWFNMKAPEVTQELKGDLQVLKMRGSVDPKRFYKKNDRDGFPKYFQVGTVVDNAVDFYHSRVPKKARKRTMVEELLADAEFRQNNKKKYQHIVMERAAQGAGRRNKKKKFQKK